MKLVETDSVNNIQNSPEEKETYLKPSIEVIEMETEGNILSGSGEHFNDGGGYDGW